MKPSGKRLLCSTMIGRCFLIFWLGAAVLTSLRCVFDKITYFNGATIVRRDRSSDYLLRLPPGWSEFDRPRPLLIYLHGAGERFADARELKKADIVHYIAGKVPPAKFPFIVVSLKSSPFGWRPDDIVRLLDELLTDDGSRFRIDPTRIYLTGFSMGGYGVWETSQQYPNRFAAVAPLAGGSRGFDPGAFAELPVWAFHGEMDDVIDCEQSLSLLEQLWIFYPNEPDKYRLTVYPDLDHGIPKRVYRDVELYRWMLRYRREKGTHPG